MTNSFIDDKFFKIEPSEDIKIQSALAKCLLNKESDNELFKCWIAKELNLAMDNETVINRLNFIVEQREKLKNISDDTKLKIVSYLSRLISAKFSGSKQADAAISLTLDKLIYSFNNKCPIIFVFGYGGYKNYNSPSFPEVDYAELFHMKYMTEYLWPIITSYEYGVTFEYESEEISIQFNNVPQDTTDKYTNSFKNLVSYFNKKIHEQNNVEVNFKSVIARDMYNPQDLYNKMNEYYSSMKELIDSLDATEKQIWFKRAKTNFLVKGTEDFSALNNEELEEKIIEARIKNECFLAADYDLRIDFWERPNAISLFGTWGKSPCASPTDGGLHLKSTKSSNTDFWIGTGVFQINTKKSKIEELILSHNQYNEFKNEIKVIKSSNQELTSISKNFEKVPYIER